MDSNDRCNGSSDSRDLQEKLQSIEADRQRFLEHVRMKLTMQEKEMEKVKDENECLKKQVTELQKIIAQKTAIQAIVAPSTNAKTILKNTSTNDDEDLLTKAKTLLFEKTKICKQQELQLEALKNQVIATKDVLDITKDMLNLRNMENSHSETRLETMEEKIKAERNYRQLIEKKLTMSQKKYDDLKAEYDLQSGIFKELRKNYEEKIAVLMKQIDTLKT